MPTKKKTSRTKSSGAAAKSTAVAKKGPQALASTDLMANMLSDAGKGIERADKDSFAVPFILCLQGLSPQLETVEGAKRGMFINSITNELSPSVRVIPVYFERQFLRWVDRDAGGGFKGAYTPLEVDEMLASGEAVRSDDGIHIHIGDTEALSDTRQHYVLVQDSSGAWTPAVVACASTQIKKSKNWLTQINNFKLESPEGDLFTPPSWARTYRITSVKESNNKGEWYGITITPDTTDNPQALVTPELYAMGAKFYEQIVKGKVTVQHEDLNPSNEADEDSGAF